MTVNFCSPKWRVLDPLFDPKLPLKKCLCGSPFCVLSQEVRHINFFLGAQKGAFGGGGRKVHVEKFDVFFCAKNVLGT